MRDELTCLALAGGRELCRGERNRSGPSPLRSSDAPESERAPSRPLGPAPQDGLDGRVLRVVGHVLLDGLRCAARSSLTPMRDLLLALFGLVLDRQERYRGASIAILASGASRIEQRPHRCGRDADGQSDGAEMPMDMRLAIASDRLPAAAAATDRAVAFLYERRRDGEAFAAPSSRPAVAGRFVDTALEVVLEVSEFSDRLLLECFFRTTAMSARAARRMMQAYVLELSAVAAALTGKD